MSEEEPRGVMVGRQILRRAPLIVVLAVLAWLFLGERPREVTVVYDLPDRPAPTRVEVQLRDAEGAIAAALGWGTGEGPAADRREQAALLGPGTYRLRATLSYADGTSRVVERSLDVSREDERIVVHLTRR